MFDGVQHVAIAVDDLEAARAFYGTVLGLEELPRPDFGIPGAWYGIGRGQQLHIAEFADHAAPERNHFALEVSDLDAAVAHMKAAGLSVRIAPEQPGAGRQAAVRDPAGNLIELNQPARSST